MPWWRWFDSLKFKVTVAGVLALALGIGATATVLMLRAEGETLGAQRRMVLEEASHDALTLSRHVVGQQRALSAAAGQLRPADLARPDELQARLAAEHVLSTLFDALFIVDAKGRMLMFRDDAGTRPMVLDVADRPYFIRTLEERRGIISEPVTSRVTGNQVVLLTWPMVHDGAVSGVLVGAITLQRRDLLATVVDPSNTEHPALVIITDAAGKIIAHPTADMRGHSIEAEPFLHGAYKRWQEAGSPAELSGIDISDREHLTGVAAVPGTDWLVWRTQDVAGLLAPLRDGRTEAIRVAIGVVVVLAVGLGIMLRWLLRPLYRLEKRADRLFDSDIAPDEGWPAATGEVGQLQRVLRRSVRERALIEERNNQVLQQLSSVLAAAPVGIAVTRADQFELVSAHLCQLLDTPQDDLLGQPMQLVFASNEDYFAMAPQLAASFKVSQPYAAEWQLLRRGGQAFWARLSAQPVNPHAPADGIIWTLQDITREVASRTALEWSATHDSLTGLANRTVLEERLARAVSQRPGSMPACVLMFDLDHFKPINDEFGHAAGDAMLRAVSQAAATQVRSVDLLARIGGDEFGVLLEHCPADAAQRVAVAIRDAISELAMPWEGRSLRVGVSIGLAPLTADYTEAAQWLADADQACYDAKAAGRNTVRSHLPGSSTLGWQPTCQGLRLVAQRTPKAS